MQLDVCIELIFTDRDYLERINAVADAGLHAFEIWEWKDKDIASLVERKERHGLSIVNMNYYPTASILDGNGVDAFVQGIRESCMIAKRLGCPSLTCHPHDVPFGAGEPWYMVLADEKKREEWQARRSNVIAAFKSGARIAEHEAITLLMEPLNTLVDHSGSYLVSSAETLSIIREIGSPALRLLFDVYHQQITEGNVTANLAGNIDVVGHVHLADVPGRHQPGTGEINFVNLLRAARSAGYDGFVGLEYIPLGDHADSLGFIKQVVEEVEK